MRTLTTSAYSIAQRFVGLEEVPGISSNPAILAMLRLDAKWPSGDSVPWCSAFTNYIAWLLNLPRTKSLVARSWLGIGEPVDFTNAVPGFDVVILKRGDGPQPGAEDLQAPGHVGFFAGWDGNGELTVNGHRPRVLILAGNQGDAVSIQSWPTTSILGIRRLA